MARTSKKELMEHLRGLAKKKVVVPTISDETTAHPVILDGDRTALDVVRCPECGAPLDQEDLTDDGICTCDYCGTLVRVGVKGRGR